MLIWLGKQYLGQKDQHENTDDDADNEVVIKVVRVSKKDAD